MIGRALALLVLAAAAANAQTTWRGLAVEPECGPYDRGDYRYAQSIRDRILAGEGAQPAAESPYSGVPFSDGGSWDIEHIVATSEAHKSGLCRQDLDRRREFAGDMRNLTLARPALNRGAKSAKDAAQWLPDINRCWYAETIVAVKAAYALSVDQAEADALDAVLAKCKSCPPPLPDVRNRENLLAWRAEERACRDRAEKERVEAERAAEAALRQPPARVWRIGRWVGWEPPASSQPDRYQVSTPRAVIHDGPLGSSAREYNGRLAGDDPIQVAASYDGEGSAAAPWIEATPGDPPYLVSHVRFWATERWHGRAHVERWRRALAGMGVVECKLGHASRPPVCPLEPAMTAAEAETMARRYSRRRWAPVVRVLQRLEAER